MSKTRKPDSFMSERPGDKLLDIVIWIIVAFAVLVTLYPFLYVVSVAFSDGGVVARGEVYLFPKGFSLETFKTVMAYKQLWVAYGNTAFYTVLGTVCNIIFTCLGAYPLSRRHFFLRRKL